MDRVDTPLERLQDYIGKVKETDYALENTNGNGDYEARINKTLQFLQKQVKQQKDALEKLRAANIPFVDEPSPDPKIRLRQLHTITAAYQSLTPAEPLLPLPDSPLPALLALRSTLNVVDQTKTSILETKEDIEKAEQRLRQEEADLKDARSITRALKERIVKVQREHEEQSQKSNEDVIKDIIQEQVQQRRHYTMELRNLVKAFNRFVDQDLAAMVAVEDLGGPVVGDLLDIDEDTLRTGFTQQGRPKKAKADKTKDNANRKRRNEEIWGSEDEDMAESTRSEKHAAGASFRKLTEDLLNAAAGEDDSDPYIKISSESAAVRFLVRAKVAQFHPDDARQLRLIDFGLELDEL